MITLPRAVLWRVALRSLFIQAGFSPEAMQSLGLLYALEPAWPHLYPDPAQRQEAVKRHLTPFNTHPYAAAALVGGILFHEQLIARGEETAADVLRFKKTLMGPLAALGDGFYWLSLRPATAALSAALAPFIGPWAAVLFLVTYNVVHLVTRGWLFVTGFQSGEGVVARLVALRVPTWSNRLRTVTAISAVIAGLTFAWALGALGGTAWLGLAALGLGGVSAAALERGLPPLVVLYLAALVAAAAGVLW